MKFFINSERTPFSGTEEEFLAIKDGFWKKVFTKDDGKFHRENGPAVIYSNGDQEWCQDGQYHRIGGPARFSIDGVEGWFQNGKKHRENGPAIIDSDGHQEYWINGNKHRIDGPAIIKSDGTQEWYICGYVAKNLAVNANYIKERFGINIFDQDCLIEIDSLFDQLKESENVSKILSE